MFSDVFSLKDDLDLIEEQVDQDFVDLVDDIFIEPLENDGFDSGEDDVADDGDNFVPDALCAGQLNSGCEISLRSGRRIEVFQEIEVDVVVEVDDEVQKDEIVVASVPPARKKQRINLSDTFQWTEDNSNATKPIFPEPNYEDCVGLQPHQQFEKFFDDVVLKHIHTLVCKMPGNCIAKAIQIWHMLSSGERSLSIIASITVKNHCLQVVHPA